LGRPSLLLMDISSSRLANDDADKESMFVLCSEEEFDDNENNVVLPEMINEDDKVEEPRKLMIFSTHC
jgi:hypothetical protein